MGSLPGFQRNLLAMRLLIGIILSAASLCAAQRQIEGTVRSDRGVPVENASLLAHDAQGSATAKSDANGYFAIPLASDSASISVTATGFAPAETSYAARHPGPLEITLRAVSERVLVSATRTATRGDEAPGSSVLLSPTDLQSTPALATDDLLRQIPGFILFRRQSSRYSNPTSQGVSLRGVGASGASRALVLVDGVPLNDPFGGWVYWDRVPRESVATAEIVRGGASSLYGSSALGGVMQLLTRPPQAPAISLEAAYGNQQTPDFSFWTGGSKVGWDGAISVDLFRSDGYILVPASARGSVDTPANSAHSALNVTMGHHFGEHGRVFAGGAYFDESRNNGTPIQTNDTQIGQGILGADTGLGAAGTLAVRFYGSGQSYRQNFSSVAASRNSESLTNQQHVPSQQLGGTAQWSRPLGRRQTLVAGVDAQETAGLSLEDIFSAGAQTFRNNAGGHQRTFGLFGEDIVNLPAGWILTAGIRYDHWRNFSARRISTSFSAGGTTTTTLYPDRAEDALSPRLSLLRRFNQRVSLSASGYRAFRAPVLNELYRTFTQGNTRTLNNPALRAEHLTGAECGVSTRFLAEKLNLRGTFFWSQVVNPIANVTLSTTSTLIVRQRQNLGRTQSTGLELDGTYHISPSVELSGGYQLVHATVLSFPADLTLNASLVGNRLPQVPQHQFTLQARYWNPRRLMFAVQGRYSGSQFDDDLNTLLLDRFFTLDVMAGRELRRGVEVFAAVENLFNERYNVALTPIANQGPPILARIGIRLNLPGH
jgi:outer membrane receptor protein involved in Fe transport